MKIEETVKRLKKLRDFENVILIKRRIRISLINIITLIIFLLFMPLRATFIFMDKLTPIYTIQSFILSSAIIFIFYLYYYALNLILIFIIIYFIFRLTNSKEIKKEKEIIKRLEAN